jgi:hypothetical protein
MLPGREELTERLGPFPTELKRTKLTVITLGFHISTDAGTYVKEFVHGDLEGAHNQVFHHYSGAGPTSLS